MLLPKISPSAHGLNDGSTAMPGGERDHRVHDRHRARRTQQRQLLAEAGTAGDHDAHARRQGEEGVSQRRRTTLPVSCEKSGAKRWASAGAKPSGAAP